MTQNSNLTFFCYGISELIMLGEVLLVSRRVLHEPFFECLKVTVTVILDARLVVLGVELEGWVAFNCETFDFVGGGVELSNDEVINLSNVIGELSPYGGKGLTVTAPWGIVLHKHILGGIIDNSVKAGANENGLGGNFSWLGL